MAKKNKTAEEYLLDLIANAVEMEKASSYVTKKAGRVTEGQAFQTLTVALILAPIFKYMKNLKELPYMNELVGVYQGLLDSVEKDFREAKDDRG